jgi:hypothetical protein
VRASADAVAARAGLLRSPAHRADPLVPEPIELDNLAERGGRSGPRCSRARTSARAQPAIAAASLPDLGATRGAAAVLLPRPSDLVAVANLTSAVETGSAVVHLALDIAGRRDRSRPARGPAAWRWQEAGAAPGRVGDSHAKRIRCHSHAAPDRMRQVSWLGRLQRHAARVGARWCRSRSAATSPAPAAVTSRSSARPRSRRPHGLGRLGHGLEAA